jgi:hypothetical protein
MERNIFMTKPGDSQTKVLKETKEESINRVKGRKGIYL